MTAPTISIAQIRKLASRSSYERGENYYQSGAIQNPVRRGDRLEADCEGSGYEPYRVEVTLGAEQGIKAASCTCDYNYEGYCKHIVALLLTYLHKPERFEAREATTTALSKRSKEELIALIQQMLALHPDLHTLVDQPPATSKKGASQALNTESFRKQIRKAIKGFYSEYDYSDGRNIGSTLNSVIRTAQDYANQGDYVNASALGRAILDEVFQDEDAYLNMDDDGWLSEQVDEVLKTLYRCLEHLREDDAERLQILHALLTTRLFDMLAGGMDIGPDAWDYLLRFIQPADMTTIRARIEAAKPTNTTQYYGQHKNSQLQDMLADLDIMSGGDPEVVLQRLREDEEWSLLFSRLISLKRIDEAVAVIEEHLTTSYERFRHLDELASAGQEGAAIRLAEATLQTKYDTQLGGWLLERLLRNGDDERRLRWYVVRLKTVARIEYYTAIQDVAVKLGQWDKLRPQLIAWLEEQQHFSTLTRVRLHEGDYELAWMALEKVPRSNAYTHDDDILELDVADQTREQFPEKAIPLYIKHIREAIDQRNRDDYQRAAHMLVIVRDLYDRMDEFEKWETLIAGIRRDFPKLRALHDEMKKLKL